MFSQSSSFNCPSNSKFHFNATVSCVSLFSCSILPSIIVAVGYAIAFFLLSVTVKTMPVGIVYAIWSGAGIVLVAGIGYFAYGQKLDLPAVAGIALILSGVLVVNLFSNTAGH